MSDKNRELALCFALVFLTACQHPMPPKAESAPISATTQPLGELKISMLDMSYQPAVVDVTRSGRYVVWVKNDSRLPHDIEFGNGARLNAGPGETVSITVNVPDEGLAYRCSMPGHEQAGMQGVISVNGQTPGSLRSHNHLPETEIAPERLDPRAPKLMPGKLHEIELVAIEKT